MRFTGIPVEYIPIFKTLSDEMSLVLPGFAHIKILSTCLIWYAVSSITSQLTRLVLSHFKFPLVVGFAQFIISATLALSLTLFVRAFPSVGDFFTRGTVPNGGSTDPLFNFHILIKVAPLGLLQFAGKFFSLTATSLVPLATVSSIKALSPLLIVSGYRIFYRIQFPWATYVSLIPLMAGVLIIVIPSAIEKQNQKSLLTKSSPFDPLHVTGLVCCVFSTVIFAVQNIYGRELMTWNSSTNFQTKHPINPNLTPYMSVVGTPESHPTSKKLNTMRRRSSFKLPYSVSDLLLDKFYNHHSEHSPCGTENVPNWLIPISRWHAGLKISSLDKPDKISIILYCSILGAIFSLGGVLVREVPLLLHSNKRTELCNINSNSDIVWLILVLLLDSVSHFMQTLLAFHMLGLIPALSYSIASMMKRIVLILMSILLTFGARPSEVAIGVGNWWGRITRDQILGLILITIGLYCYARWGSFKVK